jgi:PAS domain S-box-containing protein
MSKKASTIDIERESHFSEELIEDRTFLLASIVESSDDAIITKTSKGIITSWNSGAEKIYGFSAREVIGKPISILTPPGHADEVPGILERIQQGESIRHYETVRRRRDGRIIDVSVSISPLKDKKGRLVGASTIARDITAEVAARKESQEKLAVASQYARSLIESSLDPLVTISADGKITDVNEATIKVTGVPREQLIGLLQLLHGAWKSTGRLPAGFRPGFRHGLSSDDPPSGRPADGRAVQRQRL